MFCYLAIFSLQYSSLIQYVLQKNLFIHIARHETQSIDWFLGPPELVQYFRLKGEFPSAQERCLT